jgi:single-strand DNA-binding protein
MAKLVKMARLNEVTVSGFLGNDPKTGDNYAMFNLASKESWKDKQGEWQDRTTWVPVSCFGKTADAVKAGAFKGTAVIVLGKLSSYENKETKRQVMTVLANRVLILTPDAGDAPAAAEPKPRAENPGEPGDGDNKRDPLDDIPW